MSVTLGLYKAMLDPSSCALMETNFETPNAKAHNRTIFSISEQQGSQSSFKKTGHRCVGLALTHSRGTNEDRTAQSLTKGTQKQDNTRRTSSDVIATFVVGFCVKGGAGFGVGIDVRGGAGVGVGVGVRVGVGVIGVRLDVRDDAGVGVGLDEKRSSSCSRFEASDLDAGSLFCAES